MIAAIVGAAGLESTLAAAAEKAPDGLALRADAHMSEAYRRSLAVTFTARALARAAKRARG